MSPWKPSNSNIPTSAKFGYLNRSCIFVAMGFNKSNKGKRVVDQKGNMIDTVDNIKDGNAHIKKSGEEKVIDAITTSLGWDDSAIQELQSKHVDSIDDTEIEIQKF
jgi:hypothetical protein